MALRAEPRGPVVEGSSVRWRWLRWSLLRVWAGRGWKSFGAPAWQRTANL